MSAPITYAGRTWPSAYEWCLSIMQHNVSPGPAQDGQCAALAALRSEVLAEAADDLEAQTCGCGCRRGADLLRYKAAEAGKDTPAGGESTQPAELTVWVGGEECTTGYVVTALTVASACDPEADE